MKKSTILLLVVVYVIAFFIVGLLGMQLRSAYSVSYLNEIRVTPFEETPLVLKNFTTESLGSENEPEKMRVVNNYTYNTNYTGKGMVIKLNVSLLPNETTVNDYQLYFEENEKFYSVVKNEDLSIFVTINKVYPGSFTDVTLILKDKMQHGVKTTVNISVIN